MSGITTDVRSPVGDAAGTLRVTPVTALPERLVVGGGTALFVDGRCSQPARIEKLTVAFDGVERPAMGWGMPMPGHVEGEGYWWTIVTVEALAAPRLAWVELRAALRGGGEAVGRLGAVELRPDLEPLEPWDISPRSAAAQAGRAAAGRSVAICMATHEPPRELLDRQIASIREQTHDDWVCLISDDASSPEALESIHALVGDDERFAVSASDRHLGFYGNFERALSMVPPDADFVALSDQDDRWRPDKLAKLLDGRGDARLVYSDMRIVEPSGEVVSDTYWSFRRNNYTDFASLLVANTVTGAASLFERSLLADVLPFPPRQGNSYHDHWIAEVALALGGLSYVDEPLHDYVQHGEAAIGHLAANNVKPGTGRVERVRTRARQTSRHALRPGWREYYFNIYCRTVIASRTLSLRCGDRLGDERRRVLEKVTEEGVDVPWLIRRAARRLSGSTETLGREGAILRGIAWRDLSEARMRARRVRARFSRVPTAEPARIAAEEEGSAWLRPILVDYFTRDGSTLMMQLLASSPQIAVEDVYPYERKYFAYFWRWAQILDRVDWPEGEWGAGSLGSLDQLRNATLIGPPPWQPRPLIDPLPGQPELSRRCFELAWGEFSRRATERCAGGGAPGAVRYAAEKHLNTWLVPLEQLPEHELIVLLRDPRDSWVSMRSFEDGASFGGEHRASEERLLEHVISRQRERLRWIAGLLARGGGEVIRYEELIRDLDGVAAALSARLAVDLSPAAVLAGGETRARHVSAASPEASIERWRDELSTELANVFAHELGPELRALGFEA